MASHKILNLLIIFGSLVLSGNTTSDKAFTGPTTAAGLNLIKEYECFHPNFYTNSKNTQLIGYGYVCEDNLCAKLRPPITVAQATNLLKSQIKSFESCVNQNVKCGQLNAAQFSAIVSFTFNVGCDNLKRSTLLTKLNKNDISGTAAEFAKHNKDCGKVQPELTRRRAAERQLFCSNKAC